MSSTNKQNKTKQKKTLDFPNGLNYVYECSRT